MESNEPSITQALHLMNSPEIQEKIEADTGLVTRLCRSNCSAEEIIDDLTLATLARYPTAEERALFLDEFKRSERVAAAEDVLWTLLNSKEFLYNH